MLRYTPKLLVLATLYTFRQQLQDLDKPLIFQGN